MQGAFTLFVLTGIEASALFPLWSSAITFMLKSLLSHFNVSKSFVATTFVFGGFRG